MALRIKADGSQIRIQFVLPDDIHVGPVSAVGSFNDWKPGAHTLVRRSNGTRSVTVAVPAGSPSSSAISAKAVSGSTTRMPSPSPLRAPWYAPDLPLHEARLAAGSAGTGRVGGPLIP